MKKNNNAMKNFNNLLSKKRILITGGAGFIGSALIRYLLKNTDSLIFNLDKIGYSSDFTSINECIKKNNIDTSIRYRFLKVNLSNKDETKESVRLANPDYIINLAAESHVDRSINEPYEFISSNIIGTFNLLQSALEHYRNLKEERKNIFRFHHVSTDEVYGSLNENGSFSEITKYDPRSPYSASKASSDHFVNAWNHTYGLPVITTNCSNNFGPWQYPEKLIPLVINKALNDQKIPIYGDGLNIRDWLFVEDHVNGILLSLLKGEIGQSYCIGANNEKRNKDVVFLICDLMDKIRPKNNSYKDLITFVDDRPGHDRRYSIDSSLIRNQLNWSPLTNFEEGIEMTINWYIKNEKWSKERYDKSGYKGERIGLID